MEVQGWVVTGLAVVLFGYLIPYVVRGRQQLADSRMEDRFSGTMRVVATGATARRPTAGEHHGRPEARPYLHDPRRRTETPAVTRSTSSPERSATDARRLAALRAARAAQLSRRQAAARRRLILTVLLLTLSLAGWVTAAATAVSVAAGIVPTVLLGGVLVLGRRAAKQAEHRNAADRDAIARLQLQPADRGDVAARRAAITAAARAQLGRGATVTVPGAAPQPTTAPVSDDATTATPTAAPPADATSTEERGEPAPAADQPAAPTGTAEAPSAATTDDAATDDGWTPVPVPAPTYTLKPTAPRRDIAGYVQQPAAPATAEVSGADADPSLVALEGSPYSAAAGMAPVAERTGPAEATAGPGAGLDLTSVLARRRAAVGA